MINHFSAAVVAFRLKFEAGSIILYSEKIKKNFLIRTNDRIFVSNDRIMKGEADYTVKEAKLEAMLVEEPDIAYSPQGLELISLSRKGIFKQFLLELADKLTLTMQELARILHISERTLQRYHKEDKMASDVSERALLLAQLYQKGIFVFGSSENFNDWLRTPLPAFQQQAPVAFLDTAFGFALISDELGRIEHGVFA